MNANVITSQVEARRKLIVVQPGGGTQFFSQCVVENWEIDIARSLEPLRDCVMAGDYRVGIAVLCGGELESWRAHCQDALGAANSMQWIALLEPHTLNDQGVAEFIAGCFYDFHTLPVDTKRLMVTLGRAYGMAELMRGLSSKRAASASEFELIGDSAAMNTVRRTIDKISAVDAPVLINGESGTGKEKVAQAIHQHSSRKDGPFVTIDCAALPSSLIQSELFGHEKGAYTGAHQRRIGRIEAASGGTLFLDEIGDLSLDVQATLLRFLQEKTIERLGGLSSIHVDTRVIAATHIDLKRAVAEGQFREDLFHRLNVLHIEMPSLRDRNGDVERLASYFFKQYGMEKSKALMGFSRESLQVMNAYSWPGNIRELMNRVRRAMVMAEGRLIVSADLGLDRREVQRTAASLEEIRAKAEKHAILSALHNAQQNASRAAKKLGVSRVTLYRLMEKHDIYRFLGDSVNTH